MTSQQMVLGLLLAAGIAIVLLLMMPVVHLPYIVLHGPMSALRAQRAAELFNAFLCACASLFVGLLFALRELRMTSKTGRYYFGVIESAAFKLQLTLLIQHL